MKAHTVLYIFIIFLATSCSYGIPIEIKNSSDQTIEDIHITNGFNVVHLKSLHSNQSKQVFLDFKDKNPNQDGICFISFRLNDRKKNRKFGYYSNGIPLNKSFYIDIQKDSIVIEETLKK